MKKIFVNGTFDILHLGHVKLLKYAKSLGDYLLVAIDSDIRVNQLKGPNRPINTELERKDILLSLKSVDEVAVFNSDQDLIDIIKEYQLDIMVKGSDYIDKPIIGQEYCPDIKFFTMLNDYSTTKKIQDIATRGHLR